MLQTLKAADLSAKRLPPKEGLRDELAQAAPLAVIFDDSCVDRGDLVAQLREHPRLLNVPMIGRVPRLDPQIVAQVFRDGLDDYYLDGGREQFTVLVAAVKREDSWGAVRAPAGQVVLAHPERLERVRLANVLRRNGYDTFFAGTIEELEKALLKGEHRAVVASSALPGRSIVEVVNGSGDGSDPAPWVLVADGEESERLSQQLPDRPTCRILEAGADPEGLTFLMNEMLSPPPAGVRRSPRLLYGGLASFCAEGSDMWFHGYTFNASLGGVYLRSLASFPLQTRIEVRVVPPYGRGEVVAIAQVCWVKRWGETGGAASPPGMGLQFLEMWPADQAGFEAGYGVLLDRSNETPTGAAPAPHK
jgi:hypothetical protein